MWTPQSWYHEARESAEKNPTYVRGMAEHWLNTVLNGIKDVPREEVVRRLIEENQRRLDAQPDLQKYPELRGMRELIEAAWKGARDGADLDDALWASHCGASFFYHRYIASGKAMTGCSCVYFPTSDRGPLLGNNLDTDLNEPFGAPAWPALSEHLVIGSVSSGVYLDEEPPEIFPAPIFKLVARYCRSTDEAVEMLERYNHFWGPCNCLVVDRNHNVAMIEKTSCRISVRRSADGFGFVTAMTQEDPALREYVADRQAASLVARGLDPQDCDDVVYWDNQHQRRELMNELLDEARQNPTVEKMREIMQFRCEKRGKVAGGGEKTRPSVECSYPSEITVRTAIWLLGEGQAQWWAHDKEKNTPSWQNRQEDVLFKDVWLWK